MTKEIFTYIYRSSERINGSTLNNLQFNFKPPTTEKPTKKFIFRLCNWISDQSPLLTNSSVEIQFGFTSQFISNKGPYISMFHDLDTYKGLITRLPEFVVIVQGGNILTVRYYNTTTGLLLTDTNGDLSNSYFIFELIPIYD